MMGDDDMDALRKHCAEYMEDEMRSGVTGISFGFNAGGRRFMVTIKIDELMERKYGRPPALDATSDTKA